MRSDRISRICSTTAWRRMTDRCSMEVNFYSGGQSVYADMYHGGHVSSDYNKFHLKDKQFLLSQGKMVIQSLNTRASANYAISGIGAITRSVFFVVELLLHLDNY